jgi:hypothetical protein
VYNKPLQQMPLKRHFRPMPSHPSIHRIITLLPKWSCLTFNNHRSNTPRPITSLSHPSSNLFSTPPFPHLRSPLPSSLSLPQPPQSSNPHPKEQPKHRREKHQPYLPADSRLLTHNQHAVHGPPDAHPCIFKRIVHFLRQR